MLAVLQTPKFYEGIATLKDYLPKSVYVQPNTLESFFIEGIIEPDTLSTIDLLRYGLNSANHNELDHALDIVSENYSYLNAILAADFRKQLPFLIAGDYSLEQLYQLSGSYSFALRMKAYENKDSRQFTLPTVSLLPPL